MVNIREDGRIEFKFYRPNASDVRVAGDFDKWAGRTAMRSAGRGWWILDAELPPGEYRFCYRADGQKYADYAAFGVEATVDGWNSVLIVPEFEATAMQIEDQTEQSLEPVRIAA
ncbi:MAG TPA: glycogen-binding domain-containing protein [Tepidisphaeraceae bacterium]|nr:glycogen-binding domain-containing protein [Tepidisphaeraceae bacterium]